MMMLQSMACGGTIMVAALAVGVALPAASGSSPFPAGYNGRAKTPPMGWRCASPRPAVAASARAPCVHRVSDARCGARSTWNAFHNHIDQPQSTRVMEALAAKNRTVLGEPAAVSLAELGYTSFGIDEGWAACDVGQHDPQGHPTINTTRFPSMSALVSHGHGLGLTVEWYMNGCGCVGKEHNPNSRQNYEGDVAAIRAHGFDGVKFDGALLATRRQQRVSLLTPASCVVRERRLRGKREPHVVRRAAAEERGPTHREAGWCAHRELPLGALCGDTHGAQRPPRSTPQLHALTGQRLLSDARLLPLQHLSHQR
jgi:hypothetical protein